MVRAAEPVRVQPPERRAPPVPAGPFEDPAQLDAFDGPTDEESKL
jgi:hypothetical protein